jgi:hypothetical protein
MAMRWLHLIVVATLVSAAVDVYKIKFESTVQAERVAKLYAEIRRERDTTAALRAEWAQLDNPARIQALVQRHLALKATEPTQIDTLDHLPDRPPPGAVPSAPPASGEAVADVFDDPTPDDLTGSTTGVRIEPLPATPDEGAQ